MSTKKEIPTNLTWPQFRAYYAKHGNKKKGVSEAWKDYKNKEEETEEDISLVVDKRKPVKTRISPTRSILKTTKTSAVNKKKQSFKKGNTPPEKVGFDRVVIYEIDNESGFRIGMVLIKLVELFSLGDISSFDEEKKTSTKNKYVFKYDNGKIISYESPKKKTIVEIYYNKKTISSSKLKKIDKDLSKLKINGKTYSLKRIEDTDIELESPEKRQTVKGRIPAIIAEINIVEKDGNEKRTTITESIFGYLRENILEHAKEVQEEDKEALPVVPVRVEYIDNKHIKIYLNYNFPLEGAKKVILILQQFFDDPYSIRGKKYKVVVVTSNNKKKYF